jgi:two-component system OmpR family response regulator
MQTAINSHDTQHTILIVEDEKDMCTLLESLLATKNARIFHVRTLFEAQNFLKHDRPSLILLDNRLPDGYGVDFIPFAKENCPSVKILMLSGVDPAAEDFALESGADNFLAKPFTKKELCLSVDLLLN